MLVSIQLNSNRPQSIIEFISNIEETVSNPSDIEVLIHIDEGDIECQNIIESLQTKTSLKLRYIQTDIIKHYKDLWKPLNILLQHTDPNAYFVTNFSDEFRFKTKGWDDVIRKYIHYYEDDIFRIRLSRYRYRNYRDFWECVFAPDSVAFYTKRWMDIVGQWCPCLGPDSWQQAIAFYLVNSRKFDHIQYNRDIAEPFLKFEGEGASIGLTKEKMRQRIKDNIDLWFDTVSHKMQEKAAHGAARLEANIIASYHSNQKAPKRNFTSERIPPALQNFSSLLLQENPQEKCIEIRNGEEVLYRCKYGLNKAYFAFTNTLRKLKYFYYAGGGNEVERKSLVSQFNIYLRYSSYKKFKKKIHISLERPKYYKNSAIKKIFWPIKKIFLVLFTKIIRATSSEKCYRFYKFKLYKFYHKKWLNFRKSRDFSLKKYDRL